MSGIGPGLEYREGSDCVAAQICSGQSGLRAYWSRETDTRAHSEYTQRLAWSVMPSYKIHFVPLASKRFRARSKCHPFVLS